MLNPNPTPEPTPNPTPEPTPAPVPTPPVEKTFTKAEMDAMMTEAKQRWEADSQLSEVERMKKDLLETQNALRERDTRDTVQSAAKTAGVNNPELFYKAVKSEIQFDGQTGKVSNLDAVLEAAKTSFPQLFVSAAPAPAVPSIDASAGAGAGAGNTLLTKAQIEAMTPAQIQQNWEQVSKSLASLK